MSISQPGNRLWIAVFAYFLIVVETAWAQPDQKPPASSDKATEIKNLLKERRELRKTILNLLVAQAQSGAVNLQSVYQAQRDLLQATLDIADSPEGRIAALKDQLKSAEALAKFVQEAFTRGTTSKVETLRANTEVLEARIELLREESKAKTGK
jgi:outer membrane protein TolC